jgi:hypothetical protein
MPFLSRERSWWLPEVVCPGWTSGVQKSDKSDEYGYTRQAQPKHSGQQTTLYRMYAAEATERAVVSDAGSTWLFPAALATAIVMVVAVLLVGG